MNQIKIIMEYWFEYLEANVNEFLKSMSENKNFKLNDVKYSSVLVDNDLVEFICDEEVDELYKQFESTDWENKAFLNAYPGLHRDSGIGILAVVANATFPIKTVDNSEFRNDTLFCEGIYEIDFSTNKFISTYNNITVEIDLDNLPTDEEYLTEMGVDQLVW